MPPDVAEHVLVVAREALSNAARHPDATVVSLTLDVDAWGSSSWSATTGGASRRDGRRGGLANLAARATDVGVLRYEGS